MELSPSLTSKIELQILKVTHKELTVVNNSHGKLYALAFVVSLHKSEWHCC